MISIDDVGIKIKGRKYELMSEMTLLIRHMVQEEILTYDELEENIRLSKMSAGEILEEIMKHLEDEEEKEGDDMKC